MSDTTQYKAGDVLRVKYPFVRCEVDVPEDDGFVTIKSWKPGTESVFVYPDDSEDVAHGEGEMVLTIVDTFKPGKYPERIFFTRRWVRPDGAEFGKGKLHVLIRSAFTRRVKGYMHAYRLIEQLETA